MLCIHHVCFAAGGSGRGFLPVLQKLFELLLQWYVTVGTYVTCTICRLFAVEDKQVFEFSDYFWGLLIDKAEVSITLCTSVSAITIFCYSQDSITCTCSYRCIRMACSPFGISSVLHVYPYTVSHIYWAK